MIELVNYPVQVDLFKARYSKRLTYKSYVDFDVKMCFPDLF